VRCSTTAMRRGPSGWIRDKKEYLQRSPTLPEASAAVRIAALQQRSAAFPVRGLRSQRDRGLCARVGARSAKRGGPLGRSMAGSPGTRRRPGAGGVPRCGPRAPRACRPSWRRRGAGTFRLRRRRTGGAGFGGAQAPQRINQAVVCGRPKIVPPVGCHVFRWPSTASRAKNTIDLRESADGARPTVAPSVVSGPAGLAYSPQRTAPSPLSGARDGPVRARLQTIGLPASTCPADRKRLAASQRAAVLMPRGLMRLTTDLPQSVFVADTVHLTLCILRPPGDCSR